MVGRSAVSMLSFTSTGPAVQRPAGPAVAGLGVPLPGLLERRVVAGAHRGDQPVHLVHAGQRPLDLLHGALPGHPSSLSPGRSRQPLEGGREWEVLTVHGASRPPYCVGHDRRRHAPRPAHPARATRTAPSPACRSSRSTGRRPSRASTRRPSSASPASTRSPAASTRRCTPAGRGRCGSTPASAPPRSPTSATTSWSRTAPAGLSVAFDLPTQMGYDSDDADRARRGRQGRRRDRLDRRHAAAVRRHPARRGVHVDDDQRARRAAAAALPARRRGAGRRRRQAHRHDPERRAQGVHRPRHLHLPAAASRCG